MAYENKELAVIKKEADKTEVITKAEYEFRLKEIARCKKDIIYFAENYFRIINLDRGLEVIKLYDVQKELIEFLTKNDRIIVCSGRQQGKSTIYCIYALWQTCFFPEKKIMLLANAAATALELLSRISMAYSYLPSFLKPSITVYNKGEIGFANKSTIRAFASSSDGARGFSCNTVILDEFAFLPKHVADKLFASTFPVISSSANGKIIIVSTPNGTGNLYHNIWLEANSKSKNQNGWKPFAMYWWQVPGHDEKWKAAQIAAIGKERFAQEFNNEFLSGSNIQKLIPDDIIDKYRQAFEESKSDNLLFPYKDLSIEIPNTNKVYGFRMWEKYEPAHVYLASGDVAEGGGGDSSVLYIWDVTHLDDIRLCAKFSNNKILPIEFAYITNRILRLYNKPWYICESNGLGTGYLDILFITYEYPNIVRESKNNGLGIRSHNTIKSKACLWTQEMFTTFGFNWTIPDLDLINEMPTFIKQNTKMHLSFAAATGSHDDHIMSLIWCAWLLSSELLEKYFVVVETFISSLGKTLPKTLQSYYDATNEEIHSAVTDPLNMQFAEYLEQIETIKNPDRIINDLSVTKNTTVTDVKTDTILTQYQTQQNMIRQPSFGNFDSNSNIQQQTYQPNFGFVVSGGNSSSLFDDDWGNDSWN